MTYNPEHGIVPTDAYLTAESLAIRTVVDDLYNQLEPWIFETPEEKIP